MCNYIPNDIIPIKWFGDRRAYNKSKVKVVTVGLNPSDKEFRERDEDSFSTNLRFPHYQVDRPRTLTGALNAYFKTNPYSRWFNSFEIVLNGMGASYYDKDKYSFRALHTDICSHWATTPTWSKLPEREREALYDEGHPQWVKLIKQLKPDIIVASVAQEYINRLGIVPPNKAPCELCRFDCKEDGSLRQYPVIVFHYNYGDIPFINCSLLCNPHTALTNESKTTIGTTIKKEFRLRS